VQGFRTDAASHDATGLPLWREVRLGFEVGRSFYEGNFRLTASTPGLGPCRYRFFSAGPIVVSTTVNSRLSRACVFTPS